MRSVYMEYSEERGTWNIFVDNEWYFETDNYEQAEKMFDTFFWNDEEDY